MRTYLWLPALAVTLASCTDAVQQEAPVRPVSTVSAQSLNVPPFRVPTSSIGQAVHYGTHNTPRTYFEDTYEVTSTTKKRDLSWQEADRQVRTALTRHADKPYHYLLEQTAAGFMLNVRLFYAPRTPESIEAVAYYVDMLDRNRAIDTRTMLRALTMLDGHWSDAKVEAVAGRVHENAVTYLEERGASCIDANCRTVKLPEFERISSLKAEDARALTTLYDISR